MNQLYLCEEWKSLSKLDRAQFLLVVEGLKKGAIIEENWTSVIDIIKMTGLGYELSKGKYYLNPVIVVAKPEDLQEHNRLYLTLPKHATRDDFDKIEGWLLGYPECCTVEYVKERTPEQKRAQRNGQRHLSYKFGQELDAQIKAKGSYPEIFDYRPPSFTPCGIKCPEATRVLTSWKQVIDTLDSEAGKELVYFNRRDFPERLAHQEYLRQENQRRSLEYRFEMLRRSLQ